MQYSWVKQFLNHHSDICEVYKFNNTRATFPLTDNERGSVVARFFGFGAGRENDVDDPEAGGVMNPQQKHCEQRPVTRRPHVLCRAAAARRFESSCGARGGGGGGGGRKQMRREVTHTKTKHN